MVYLVKGFFVRVYRLGFVGLLQHLVGCVSLKKTFALFREVEALNVFF